MTVVCRIRGHRWGKWQYQHTFQSRPHKRVLEKRTCKRGCPVEQTRAYDLVLEPDLY